MTLRAQQGFTLVELLVTVVLVNAGLLAVAGATALLVRRHTDLRMRVTALTLASNRLRLLGAGACAAAAGTGAVGPFAESWSVEKGGGARSLRDSVAYKQSGITRAVVLSTSLPC